MRQTTFTVLAVFIATTLGDIDALTDGIIFGAGFGLLFGLAFGYRLIDAIRADK